MLALKWENGSETEWGTFLYDEENGREGKQNRRARWSVCCGRGGGVGRADTEGNWLLSYRRNAYSVHSWVKKKSPNRKEGDIQGSRDTHVRTQTPVERRS